VPEWVQRMMLRRRHLSGITFQIATTPVATGKARLQAADTVKDGVQQDGWRQDDDDRVGQDRDEN